MTEVEGNFFEQSVAVSGQDLRSAFGNPAQEGVVGATDLDVSAGAAGVSVDVAAGVGYVQGDSIPDEGLYRVRNDAAKNSAAFEAGGIPTADATNPRIDQICAKVFNHESDGLGQRKWRLVVVPGTATAGATLANRSGAAALPASHLRLADVLIGAAQASPLPAGNIRDRRPWARGAFRRIKRNAGNLSITTTLTEQSTADLKPRIECSGVPVRVTLNGIAEIATAGQNMQIFIALDGVAWDEEYAYHTINSANGRRSGTLAEWTGTPGAGSHQFSIYAVTSGGTGILYASAGLGLELVVEELVRANADNA